MLGRDAIAALIPHQGAMCLLDRVIEWDKDRVVLATSTHRAPDNPLRLDGRLRAVHLCEYGAQAMAVHGALLARARGAETALPGMLVSLREVVLAVEYLPANGRLDVHAQCLYADGAGAQYAFRAELAGRLLASGRAAVIHPQGPLP